MMRCFLLLLLPLAAWAPNGPFRAGRAPDWDAARMDRGFWTKHGEIYNLPMIDSRGELYIRQTKFIVAASDLIADHVANRSGEVLPHVHFRDGYDDQRSLDDANRYWDAKTDSPRICERIADASVSVNNYVYMLGQTGALTYHFWLDDDDAVQRAFVSEAGVAADLSSGGDPSMKSGGTPRPQPRASRLEAGKAASERELSGGGEPAPGPATGADGPVFKRGVGGIYRVRARGYEPKSLQVVVPDKRPS